METKKEIMAEWRLKALRLNLTMIGILGMFLFLEQTLFPFVMVFFLVPILLTILILVNLVYFIFGYIYINKKEPVHEKIEKAYRWFFVLACISILIYCTDILIETNTTQKQNEQRMKIYDEWLKKGK
ncbi:MAG: hypothetical protein ACK44D_08215 [Bacteroidia bacterium]